MASRDHLSPAGETVEELSAAAPEFAPRHLGPRRDEPRRSVAERAQHVGLRVGRVGVTSRRGVPAGVPVAVVYHGTGWGPTGKSFSAALARARAGRGDGGRLRN